MQRRVPAAGVETVDVADRNHPDQTAVGVADGKMPNVPGRRKGGRRKGVISLLRKRLMTLFLRSPRDRRVVIGHLWLAPRQRQPSYLCGAPHFLHSLPIT